MRQLVPLLLILEQSGAATLVVMLKPGRTWIDFCTALQTPKITRVRKRTHNKQREFSD